jgi:hypothetical protein
MELPKPLIFLAAAHERIARLTSKTRERDNASHRARSTDAALAVKTERFPPTGYPRLRQGADALLTASLDPHQQPNGQRGCQPGDLTARKDAP